MLSIKVLCRHKAAIGCDVVDIGRYAAANSRLLAATIFNPKRYFGRYNFKKMSFYKRLNLVILQVLFFALGYLYNNLDFCWKKHILLNNSEFRKWAKRQTANVNQCKVTYFVDLGTDHVFALGPTGMFPLLHYNKTMQYS